MDEIAALIELRASMGQTMGLPEGVVAHPTPFLSSDRHLLHFLGLTLVSLQRQLNAIQERLNAMPTAADQKQQHDDIMTALQELVQDEANLAATLVLTDKALDSISQQLATATASTPNLVDFSDVQSLIAQTRSTLQAQLTAAQSDPALQAYEASQTPPATTGAATAASTTGS